jgi:hypothetical protein
MTSQQLAVTAITPQLVNYVSLAACFLSFAVDGAAVCIDYIDEHLYRVHVVVSLLHGVLGV